MTLSIIIKALNEAERIESAVKHALAAVGPLGGEVILADSGSTDGTVEIAKRFPIRIVQLGNLKERCCGIGPELGFRHAKNPFVAISDGDMEFDPEFASTAVKFLIDNPNYGGVSGQLREMSLDQLEYKRRDQRKPADMTAGDVDRLNGGGVFRRAAVEQSGYLTDRNLHGYEEYDLAVRLRQNGWKLMRLGDTFVTHYGHRSSPYKLLWRRLKSKYLFGIGELTRAHVATPRFNTLLSELREIKLWIAIVGAWVAAIIGVILAPGWGWAVLWLGLIFVAPIVPMSLKYKSLEMGTYAVVAWHFHAYGFLRGFFASRTPPTDPIHSKVLHDATAKTAPADATA